MSRTCRSVRLKADPTIAWSPFALRATGDNLRVAPERRLVEAAGVEFEIAGIGNFLTTYDF
jgi:hypothetical protein